MDHREIAYAMNRFPGVHRRDQVALVRYRDEHEVRLDATAGVARRPPAVREVFDCHEAALLLILCAWIFDGLLRVSPPMSSYKVDRAFATTKTKWARLGRERRFQRPGAHHQQGYRT